MTISVYRRKLIDARKQGRKAFLEGQARSENPCPYDAGNSQGDYWLLDDGWRLSEMGIWVDY